MKVLKSFEFGGGDDVALSDGDIVETRSGIAVRINGLEYVELSWKELGAILAARGGKAKSPAKIKAAQKNWKKAATALQAKRKEIK